MEERDETAVEEEHQTNDAVLMTCPPPQHVEESPNDRHETARTFQLGSNKSKTVKECGVCCYYLQSFSVLLVVPGCFLGVTCAEL